METDLKALSLGELQRENYVALVRLEGARRAIEAIRNERLDWEARISSAERIYREQCLLFNAVHDELCERARREDLRDEWAGLGRG